MTRHPFFPVECPNNTGKLLLTPCPGTLETNLEESLLQLKEAGAASVITLMQQFELEKHQVETIQETCEKLGLEWHHIPIDDEDIPDTNAENLWQEKRSSIHSRLDKKENVAIHCKGGSGRTGVIAAKILLERGADLEKSMTEIKALRPNAFVHKVQIDHVNGLISA